MFKPMFLLPVLFIGLIAATADCTEGPPGNRVIGVVYEKGKDTRASQDATVSILNRDRTDVTNVDGEYYIIVSSDLQSFTLVAKKPGFQTSYSKKNYNNDKDPTKADRIDLEPENPRDPHIRQIVDREISAFHSVASPKIKKLIVGDLRDLASRASPSDTAYINERLAKLPK